MSSRSIVKPSRSASRAFSARLVTKTIGSRSTAGEFCATPWYSGAVKRIRRPRQRPESLAERTL